MRGFKVRNMYKNIIMEEKVMGKRDIFRILAGLISLIISRKKLDKSTGTSSEVEKITIINGFDSYLDIPTFMRQGRELSGL